MADAIYTMTASNGKLVEIYYQGREAGFPVMIKVDGQKFTEGFPRELAADEVRRRKLPTDVKLEIGKVTFRAVNATPVKAAYEAARKAEEETHEAKMKSNVPGLDELKAAMADRSRYDSEFRAMMENENNDGARAPKSVTADVAALAERYPRASMWLKAHYYESAANYQKSLAGKEARKRIEDGGSMDEAAQILKNWLPKSSMWD